MVRPQGRGGDQVRCVAKLFVLDHHGNPIGVHFMCDRDDGHDGPHWEKFLNGKTPVDVIWGQENEKAPQRW